MDSQEILKRVIVFPHYGFTDEPVVTSNDIPFRNLTTEDRKMIFETNMMVGDLFTVVRYTYVYNIHRDDIIQAKSDATRRWLMELLHAKQFSKKPNVNHVSFDGEPLFKIRPTEFNVHQIIDAFEEIAQLKTHEKTN